VTVFRWTAPLFKLASRRWVEEDFRLIAGLLRPYVAPDGVFADLGGGTGELGAGVARFLGARVVVVDPTPQMLRRVDADPVVSVRLASAESLPFPAAYFDAVLCCDSFHHIRNQEAAAGEISRVVRSGGGVLVLDMDAGAKRARPLVFMERLLGEPAGFRSAADMESFLAGHGIAGSANMQGRNSYLFVGSLRPSL
jgi:SAM-dependent methyltransferase